VAYNVQTTYLFFFFFFGNFQVSPASLLLNIHSARGKHGDPLRAHTFLIETDLVQPHQHK